MVASKSYIFQGEIPFVVFQCDTFAHDFLPLRLHTSQRKQLRFEHKRLLVRVDLDVWEIFTAPLYFN